MVRGAFFFKLKMFMDPEVGWGVEKWDENPHNNIYFQMWCKII